MTTDEIISTVPGFRTRAEALAEGSLFGWRTAIRLQRRFEQIWVVGKMDFQPDTVDGAVCDVFRLPLLRWETEHGKCFCPVLSVLRTR